MRDSIGFVFCRHYTKAAESRFHIFTLTLSPRFMYQYCFSSAGRGNGRGAMPFLMSFVLEPEIVTLAWIDNASVQFPLNIYATKGTIFGSPMMGTPSTVEVPPVRRCSPETA